MESQWKPGRESICCMGVHRPVVEVALWLKSHRWPWGAWVRPIWMGVHTDQCSSSRVCLSGSGRHLSNSPRIHLFSHSWHDERPCTHGLPTDCRLLRPLNISFFVRMAMGQNPIRKVIRKVSERECPSDFFPGLESDWNLISPLNRKKKLLV
jgi:hypothetical protein